MPPLSPLVRWLLAGALGAATAAVTILSDGFQPLDILLILIALLGALGVVPPQTGGTQKGVVQPTVAVGVDEVNQPGSGGGVEVIGSGSNLSIGPVGEGEEFPSPPRGSGGR